MTMNENNIHQSEWQNDNGSRSCRFIPNKTLRRLNRIAVKNGMNSLTEDCPVLRDGYNVPILLAVPGIDAVGWVRCMIPATPDQAEHVFLDVPSDEFEKLPVHSSLLRSQEQTEASPTFGINSNGVEE